MSSLEFYVAGIYTNPWTHQKSEEHGNACRCPEQGSTTNTDEDWSTTGTQIGFVDENLVDSLVTATHISLWKRKEESLQETCHYFLYSSQCLEKGWPDQCDLSLATYFSNCPFIKVAYCGKLWVIVPKAGRKADFIVDTPDRSRIWFPQQECMCGGRNLTLTLKSLFWDVKNTNPCSLLLCGPFASVEMAHPTMGKTSSGSGRPIPYI